MMARSLVLLVVVATRCYGLAVNSRRQFFVAAAVGSSAAARAAEAAVLSTPICEQGVGPGCDELAGDSAFLKQLQERSAAKKEERNKASLERYNYNNFQDYFAASYPPKKLVRHKNGTFAALTDAQIDAGVKAGTIGKGSQGNGWTNYQGRKPFFFIED